MIEHFRTYGDIYCARINGRHVCVVSNPDYLQHILRRNWQNYNKSTIITKRVRMLLGNGLMASDGELWKTQRRLVQPCFQQNVIAGLTRTIIDANLGLITKWEHAARRRQAVNITLDINVMVLETMIRSVFGKDYCSVAAEFGVLAETAGRDLELVQTFSALREVVGRLIALRREQDRKATDFLGMFMVARDRDTGQQMSDTQLVSEILTLIVAGFETTSITLSWAWYLLSKHPQVSAKLVTELRAERCDVLDISAYNYTRRVLDEVLRLYPAGWLIARKALRDDHVGEYFIPAGTEIYISPYIIQRNPDLWKDPNRFDPDRLQLDKAERRSALSNLPFASGPRNCIGETFARHEMQIHLITIAARMQLRYDTQEVPELEPGINLAAKKDFVMFPEFHADIPADAARPG
jgi:cytochrome P450